MRIFTLLVVSALVLVAMPAGAGHAPCGQFHVHNRIGGGPVSYTTSDTGCDPAWDPHLSRIGPGTTQIAISWNHGVHGLEDVSVVIDAPRVAAGPHVMTEGDEDYRTAWIDIPLGFRGTLKVDIYHGETLVGTALATTVA